MDAANLWRRWPGYSNDHTLYPPIGAPMQREPVWEDRYLETIPEVDSIKSKRSSWSTLPSDPPVRTMAPPVQRNQHKEPAWSQPSPTIPPDLWNSNEDETNASYNEVSPISTPRESWGGQSPEETPISPIEPLRQSNTKPLLPAPQYQSLIPRKVSPELSHLAGQSGLRKEQTKWDPYSGEPNALGVPASTRPGIAPLEQQFPQLKERTKQILAGLREREQTKIPVWGKAPPPVAADPLDNPPQREPWKGASGRTALVPPVKNTPAARVGPPNFPQRNISRQDPEITLAAKSPPPPPPSIHYDVTSNVPETSHFVEIETTSHFRSEQPTLTIRTVASTESIGSIDSIKPVAPLKIRSRDPTPTHTHYSGSEPSSSPPRPSEPKLLQSPFRSPHPPRMFEEPIPMSSTRTESPHHDPSPITPRTPTPENFYNTKPQPVQHIDHEVGRFSWTTYATSVTESPGSSAHIVRNGSPPPPVPQLPTIRKRPVSAKFNDTLYMNADDARSQGSIVIRKPIPRKAKTATASQLKHLSLSKTLPQLPPESKSGDKIGNFESQLEALVRRKHNVNRIMRDLSENLRRNQVTYDAYKRKEIETTLQNYEEELQTIFNEQHDIGLKLHRAMKKRDRDDNYEQPTGLWIRRVTS